ncbi:MAG TPA: BamA/TamA family outer membrane protein, partial [Pirellulales bacterium]|nr:BamA/TamA family outer membrane protein [Pirellulales bacterium]
PPAATLPQQTQEGRDLLLASGVADQDVHVAAALDLSGSFLVQPAPTVDLSTLNGELQAVPGFVFAQDYPGQAPGGNGGPVYAPPTQPPIDPLPPEYGGNGTLPPPGGYDQDGNLFPPNPLLNDGEEPLPRVPIDVVVKEAQTGRVMFGVGVNSNAGLIGNVVLDEQNFDWKKVPRSWEDIRNSTAFRGAGQQFRIEAMPGTQLSRYAFTFREPFLWDTKINFSISASYFNRYFLDWTEQRAGGRVGFGYQLTPDLSASLSLGGEDVRIYNPIVPTPPELLAVLGQNPLYSAIFSLVHDTRDSTFIATQGHRVSLNLEQAWGKFSFPRAVIGFRKYFLIHERPDGSGRQVLTLTNDTGFTGSDTPIFENFFAGGYSTIRGFYFRGAQPLDNGVQVGGHFEFLNSVEYMLPITADDALRMVAFCDFGTVEPSTEIKWQDFRIAPGFGLRITIPAMGPAPIALDFAVPVHHAPGDHIQNISFFMGLSR